LSFTSYIPSKHRSSQISSSISKIFCTRLSQYKINISGWIWIWTFTSPPYRYWVGKRWRTCWIGKWS